MILAFGKTTTILSDPWGNRLSLSDPDAGTITNAYDGFGHLTSQIDVNGIITNYTYDELLNRRIVLKVIYYE